MFDTEARGSAPVRKVAKEGAYGDALARSPFRSAILRNAGELVEAGEFQTALDSTRSELIARDIQVRVIQGPFVGPGTLIEENGKKVQVMRIPEKHVSNHPAFLLYELLHRRMSLLLRTGGQRENPERLRQLLAMDKAYAESIRLGATKRTEDYDELMMVAEYIENKVNRGLERIARGELD